MIVSGSLQAGMTFDFALNAFGETPPPVRDEEEPLRMD